MSILNKTIRSLRLNTEILKHQAEINHIKTSENLCNAAGLLDEAGEPLKGLEAVEAAREITRYIAGVK